MNVSSETAEIYFKRGLYKDAVFILELICSEQIREYGPNSDETLQTRTRIAEICVVQEKYVEALTMLLCIYRLELKRLALSHPSPVDTRNRIINLLLQHGSLDLMSQVMPEFVKTFMFLMKMTKKKYQKGLLEQVLLEGSDILNDMMAFLGRRNPITFDMGCFLAVIHTTNEDYSQPLQVIKGICETKKRVVGSMDIRMASTVMTKASIYLKMANFEEALSCYCEAHSILQLALGFHHRKTLVCLRRIAEVTYTVGNYGKAHSILTEIAKSQKFLKHKELTLTKMHIGILEYARGNYEDALSVFRDIRIKRRTPKRIRAMIQNTKGATLAKLGRYNEAKMILKDACGIMKPTNLHAETLSTYRNFAVLLAKEGMVVAAEYMLIIVLATAVVILNSCHSVVFSIENDLAELWFSRGQFNEALRVFMKILTFQREGLGEYHPSTLRTKCQVAKVLKEQGEYDEALRMYNEVLPALRAHFYSQHLDCLDVQNRIASIHLFQYSFAKAFEIYYKIYKILTDNYEDDHPFLIEIIERLQNLTDHVPVNRVIEATLMENMNDLVNLINNKEDVNARDVNGCIALHYASRGGNVHILKLLLSKGAIYDTEDMFGNTPESFSANYETKLVFLLVKRLFECIETSELEKLRSVLQRERSIINARDSACRTPLMRAVAKGSIQIIQELVYQGADLSLGSEDVGNVFHMAAEKEQIDILELLIDRARDDLELFRILLDSTDNVLGMTPLHCAAKNNRLACVHLLVYHSANPFISDVLGQYAYDIGRPEIQAFVRRYSNDFYEKFQEFLRMRVPERE